MDERLRLLLVEDDEIDRMAFERFVKREGLLYEYQIAASISEAREILTTSQLDIVLMDYRLGDGTAFDLLDALGETPSLIITGTGDERIAVEAMKRGVYDYLLKDSTGAHLATLPVVVEQTLDRWRTKRELAHYQAHLEAMVEERTAALLATSEKLQAEIDRRKQTEAEIVRLAAVIEQATETIVITNLDGDIVYANPYFEESTGYTMAEALGENPRILKSGHQDERFYQELWDTVTRGETWRGVFVNQRKDDSLYHEEATIFPIQDSSGETTHYAAVKRDITERVRADEERERLIIQVNEQARKLEQILATVPTGVLLLDAQGRVLQANPVAEADLMVLAGAQVGDVLTYLGDRSLDELLASPPTSGLWHETKLDQRIFQVIARSVESGPKPEYWVLVINDVTQERQTQAQLQQQERLAAVGQLAAGIAHDFNNIMATIVLYAEMIEQSQALSERNRERISVVNQQAWYATRLITQILDFSRRTMLEHHPLDLLPLLKEQVKLLERTLPEHIEIDLICGLDEYTVDADPTRIQQMITNLAVNARDAMPDGGTLRVTLERLTVASGKAAPLPEMEAGEWVRLTMLDSGTGIPSDVLPHIFEPFFTTKEPGVGSGLGLAQVYGIVRQHRGYIDVETQVGQGTSFMIYLPALTLQTPELPRVAVSAVPHGHGEVVLVVEDEATLRAALVESLAQWNYETLEAGNGKQALTLLEAQGDQIAVVLSDVVMPVMGGKALFYAMRKKWPRLPMILLTGHPMDEEFDKLQTQGVYAWLTKPPSLEHLAQVIADALRDSENEKEA